MNLADLGSQQVVGSDPVSLVRIPYESRSLQTALSRREFGCGDVGLCGVVGPITCVSLVARPLEARVYS